MQGSRKYPYPPKKRRSLEFLHKRRIRNFLGYKGESKWFFQTMKNMSNNRERCQFAINFSKHSKKCKLHNNSLTTKGNIISSYWCLKLDISWTWCKAEKLNVDWKTLKFMHCVQHSKNCAVWAFKDFNKQFCYNQECEK